MMLRVSFLSLGLLVPSFVQAEPVAGAPVAASTAIAALVNILIPDEAMLKSANQTFDAMWSQQQDSALYKQHPGLGEFVRHRVLAEMRDVLRGELPTLRQSMAVSFSAGFDPSEIRTLLAFFSSSIGRKIYGAVFSAVAGDPAASEKTRTETALKQVMQNLTPDDERAMAAFGSSSVATKMGVVQVLTEQQVAAWSNTVSTKSGSRVAAVAAKAIAEFLASEKQPMGGQP